MSSKLMGVNGKWFEAMDTSKGMSFDDIVDFVKEHENVNIHGCRHKPIKHSDLLTEFRNRANAVGVTLVDTKVGLSRDGMKIMCVSNTEADKTDEYGLSVGFRNSTNSTQAFSGMFGTNVWICSNGLVSGLIQPSKQRNTLHNYDLFGEKIDIIFDKFNDNKGAVVGQIDTMKHTKLTDDIIGKFVKEMLTDGSMGNKHLCDIIRNIMVDVENPALNSHDDDSCFRLLNSCTKVCTHDITNPIQGSNLSRKCNNIIMKIIKDDFIPLGDMIDVEVVE